MRDKILNKIKKDQYYIIDGFDLDNIINTYFPELNYDFIATEEMRNDSCKEFNVDGILDEYDLEQLENLGEDLSTSMLLNKLAQDNILEKGLYLIKVCW